MFTRPDDLTDAAVARALRDGWSFTADEIAYCPVGFGSHHWRVGAGGVVKWFVTVDDLDTKRRSSAETRQDARYRLSAALTVAGRLRDAGLEFVIAPVASRSGDFLRRIDDRHVVALYPYVDGGTHEWGAYPSRAERFAILDRIVAVHAASDVAAGVALADDFAIPRRDELEIAMSDSSITWGPGPHGEDARQLVDENTDSLRAVLARYDALKGAVASRPERMVLTHGEPHRANTIATPEGPVLIDWDTALLAPPERDLWGLIDEDSSITHSYTRRSGIAVEPDAEQLYRLWWDLCEISLYVAEFRRPHRDTEDLRVAWRGLRKYLDPRRWAAVL